MGGSPNRLGPEWNKQRRKKLIVHPPLFLRFFYAAIVHGCETLDSFAFEQRLALATFQGEPRPSA
jgi:hypothetical protein